MAAKQTTPAEDAVMKLSPERRDHLYTTLEGSVEICRLKAINAELVEALEAIMKSRATIGTMDIPANIHKARAALAKAKEGAA